MENGHLDLKGFFSSLGIYCVCLLPAMLPIFTPLDAGAVKVLAVATGLSLVSALLMLLTDFDRRIGDPGAVFVQSLLGIGICAGLYAWLAPKAEPQVVLMSLLWIAVGLTRLTPRQVLVLDALYLGVFLNAFTGVLLDVHAARHGDALYVLVVSLVLGTFMYLRAHEYRQGHTEKAELRDLTERQTEELAEAQERIHAMTRQDLDTIALKFPFFKEELRRCKQKADKAGQTFAIGLVEIDHFQAVNERYGELVMKQLQREAVERITKVMGKHGLETAEDDGYHPLGRIGDGLYGMILPRANLKGAMACAKQVHAAVELQSFRTMAGIVNLTLTIGLVEYHPGESVEELLETVGRSLERARLHNFEELQASQRVKEAGVPVKAAASAQELRLLHYKEYENLVH